MQKTLWLPAWYPNELGRLDGDFIQRHARAVALQGRVDLIHVLRDKEGIVTKGVREERTVEGALHQTIIYYYIPPVPLLGRLLSGLRYNRLYRRAIKDYLRQEGRPDLVHVHVAGKQGLMALWLNRRMGIPFVLTEHWTGYLPEARDSGRPFPSAAWIGKKLFRKAAGISAVSEVLGRALQQRVPGIALSVIPNVVDTSLFFPAQKVLPEGPTRFIHISTLGYQKNPEAMLRAFARLKEGGHFFHLSIFGVLQPHLSQLLATLGLTPYVSVHAEAPQQELAEHIRASDALVLYSRYETFGCVLIEANACGVPAIVSDIPVIHETITEGVNGYFAAGDDAQALADVLLAFIKKGRPIDREAIAAATREKYNYARIAEMFAGFYKKALERGL